ncbi:enoyl-CoA hydratase/isomerase family protein [Phaeacidiphilus oryzae]|uniref:enoyl-CoA hydratase/isomerase family protein n=1 Tax=Phaeacidiphilus oryzae TaxID=348818 RepID=UPI00068C2767|nr:enoyl-CoA hydratase-related protein [Phaeacidiphilus oryzae]
MSDTAAAIDGGKPAEDGVRVRVEDGVSWITLARPEAANTIDAAARERIIGALERASEDPSTRCVVLGAEGRFFCTGADLRGPRSGAGDAAPPARQERPVGEVRRMLLGGAIRLISAVLDCDRPVVAAVQGTAAGIGAHLALACDLVVAAEEARFIEVFARRGLAADGLGAWLLPRLVGLRRAKELVLLAEDLPAAEALRAGLVNRVVPGGELAAATEALARRLADGPTRAHAVNKWMLNHSLDVGREVLAQEEAWAVDALSRTWDSQEGVRSFVERRPPRFRGV